MHAATTDRRAQIRDPRRFSDPWVAAGCVALTLALRIAGWRNALGNDEAGGALVGASWLRGEHASGAANLYGAYWIDRPPLAPLLYGIAQLVGGANGVRALGALAAATLVLLVMSTAREIGGRRAAAVAALLAAALASSPPLLADHTYGELIAAVFATGSMLALVRVGNAASGAARRPALLAVGGALAACAVLVKQSAFDAAVAGTIVLAVGIVRKHTWELRDLAAWLGGALVPVAATLTWAAQTHHMHALWNATVLFRYDVVGALGPESGAASAGVGKLVAPLIASGLVLLLALALVALVTKVTAPHRLLMVAWLTAGVVGILGGGFFWPHYLIEVVPVLCVAAGVLLGGSRSPALARWAVVAVLISCTIAGHWTRQLMPHSGHSDDSARAVGLWVSRHASRGDELLVIYARPGVVHASGLRSTSPYLWSAMQATRADNRRRIVKALRAEDPPEWVVRWDASDAYGLDSDGAILHDLSERYRVVGHVRRRDVLRLIHERDRS